MLLFLCKIFHFFPNSLNLKILKNIHPWIQFLNPKLIVLNLGL